MYDAHATVSTMNTPPPNPRGCDSAPQRDLLAQAIWNTMNGARDTDKDNWEKLENFVTAKARELRSEKLKRGSNEAGFVDEAARYSTGVDPAQHQPVNYASRKVFKVKRRR